MDFANGNASINVEEHSVNEDGMNDKDGTDLITDPFDTDSDMHSNLYDNGVKKATGETMS